MAEEKDFFCSDLAWEYGVPLVGSATRGDVWFLLEYRGSWGAKAFEESTIPEAVKTYLSSFSNTEKHIRILLIRQGPQKPSKSQGHLRFFIGRTSAHHPSLYEYHLDTYEDILNIAVADIISGEFDDLTHLRREPLYLVCTNGRRDKCCAVYGPDVYQAMSEETGEAVWQSSHIAGHNQAPIMLFFPHGVNYGHATPSEARRLVKAYQQGQVVLHHYRGRVCYENHQQAAEHFWREQSGVLDLPGLIISSVVQIAEDQWIVSVRGMDETESEHIQIVSRTSDFSIPITCTKKKLRPITTYHRVKTSS
jgi:hypothetical protein